MGVDIVTLVAHDMSPAGIFGLPLQIDAWTDLREMWVQNALGSYHYKNLSPEEIKQNAEVKSTWQQGETEEKLRDMMEGRYEHDDSAYFYAELDTFFGHITIYRHTMALALLREHKYANLFTPGFCEFVLGFNRLLAQKLGQQRLMYFVDSAYPPSLIEEEAWFRQKTFDQCLAWATGQFGPPPSGLIEGIKNLFFIDDMQQPIPQLNDEDILGFEACRTYE